MTFLKDTKHFACNIASERTACRFRVEVKSHLSDSTTSIPCDSSSHTVSRLFWIRRGKVWQVTLWDGFLNEGNPFSRFLSVPKGQATERTVFLMSPWTNRPYSVAPPAIHSQVFDKVVFPPKCNLCSVGAVNVTFGHPRCFLHLPPIMTAVRRGCQIWCGAVRSSTNER